jgi:hypothetical protein
MVEVRARMRECQRACPAPSPPTIGAGRSQRFSVTGLPMTELGGFAIDIVVALWLTGFLWLAYELLRSRHEP